MLEHVDKCLMLCYTLLRERTFDIHERRDALSKILNKLALVLLLPHQRFFAMEEQAKQAKRQLVAHFPRDPAKKLNSVSTDWAGLQPRSLYFIHILLIRHCKMLMSVRKKLFLMGGDESVIYIWQGIAFLLRKKSVWGIIHIRWVCVPTNCRAAYSCAAFPLLMCDMIPKK